MKHEIVKPKYFEISSGNEEALYLQIRKGFIAWIHDCEQGEELPSERELSSLLGINRRTLRQALEPLLGSGLLVRKGYKTFVNHKIGAYKDSGKNFSHPGHPVKIILLEGRPTHNHFWQQIIDEFNRQSPAYELQLKFFREDYPENKEYWQALEQEDFDLAVLPVSYRWNKMTEQHLLPVKESMKEYFGSDEFLTGTLTETSDLLRDYAYPYLFTFQMAQYRKPYHILNGQHVQEMTFEEILKYAVKEVPPEIPLFNIYYDICRDLGAMSEITLETVREQCKMILDRLDMIKKRKHIFSATGFLRNGWNVKREENLFCRHQFSGDLLDGVSEDGMENTVFHPLKGSFYWGGCGSVGICRSSEKQQAAMLFVEFLLSEQIQNLIWRFFRSAPVRVASLGTIDGFPAEDLFVFLRSCRENPKSYPPPVGSVMLPCFEPYLSGTLSREKIIEHVLRFYT